MKHSSLKSVTLLKINLAKAVFMEILGISEVYLELCQISMIEFFCENS